MPPPSTNHISDYLAEPNCYTIIDLLVEHGRMGLQLLNTSVVWDGRAPSNACETGLFRNTM